MSDFEDFRASIARTFESVVANGEATTRFAEETEREFARVWADNAALRDELHALANRVETLTRARLTEPAEVAAAMTTKPCGRCGHSRAAHFNVTEGKARCGVCLCLEFEPLEAVQS